MVNDKERFLRLKIEGGIKMEERLDYKQTKYFDKVIEYIEKGKTTIIGILPDYFDNFHKSYKKFILPRTGEPQEKKIHRILESFIKYRDEFIQVLISIAKYNLDGEVSKIIHRFFDSIIPYNNSPEGFESSNKSVLDSLKFISHELFLHTITILIKFERYEQADLLLSRKYFVPDSQSEYPSDSLVSFSVFRKQMPSFDIMEKDRQTKKSAKPKSRTVKR